MMDVEKVISDLEEQVTWIRDNDFHKFPGWGHAVIAMKDALALLKAQEPCVMIWQDIIGAVIQCKPVYIEMKDIDYEEPGGNRWAMMTQYGDSLTNGMICAMSSYITRETLFKGWYNKTWRCWTSRPTDAQRSEIPWESVK